MEIINQNFVENKDINFKQKRSFNPKEQLFKIVLTGILLGLSVAVSLFEIPIQILGVMLPLRVFDNLIIAFALPIIGFSYTLAIGIIEPWLHLLLDGDHPPIQIFFDNISNVIFIISFFFIYYYLFKLRKKSENIKIDIFKKICAGAVLIPLNAIVATFSFVLTLISLYYSPNLWRPNDYNVSIINFNNHILAVLGILMAIELLRFLLIYLLFTLVQKKIGAIKRYW